MNFINLSIIAKVRINLILNMYFVIHKIGECFLSSEYKIVSFLAVVLATIIKTS